MDREEQSGRIQNICLMIIAGLALGFVLYWLRNVLIPFVLAVFLADGLGIVSDGLTRRVRLPRALAVLVALSLGIALFSVAGMVISAALRELSDNAFTYQRQIELLVERAVNSELMQRLDLGIAAEPQDLRSLIPVERLGPMLLGTTNAILDLVGKGFIVLIFLFFLLIGTTNPESGTTPADIQNKIRRYIAIQGGLSAATGLLVGGILFALGIPLAMVFGLAAFLLNFIPSIGSIIATLLPLPVILVSPEVTPTAAVLAVLLPSLVQVTIGNFIAPKVLGDSLDLHPVTVLLALMIWGALWGVVGMLLATPMTAILRLFFDRMELTQPLADLMAGRPGESSAVVVEAGR